MTGDLTGDLARAAVALSDEAVVIAASVRDGIVDCVHRGHVAVVSAEGDLLWSAGAPHLPVFERSTAKPFRTLALLRSGAADAFGLDEADIALISGSHSGTRAHVKRGARLLRRIGIAEDVIASSPRLPLGEDGLAQLAADTGRVRKLHSECSGEHIGTLALCLHRGHCVEGYWQPEHPVQVECAAHISEFTGESAALATVADRCLMPTSAYPLDKLAERLARLVAASDNDTAVAQLCGAIRRHPRVYTGHGRLIGDLIEASDGQIVGKCGAGGLYTLAWPAASVALAVKVIDGSHRAAVPAMRQASRDLGLPFPAPSALSDPYADFAFTVGVSA